jgi:putative peptidoglycan lipid II flippase
LKTEVTDHQEDRNRVVFYAISMAIGTFSSRVLGLLRDMAFAALFSRTVRDAWTAAFRLPNLFRRLLGEGSLSVSFIPVFVEAKLEDEKNGGCRAKNLVNAFYTCLLCILSILTALGILQSEWILRQLLDIEYIQNQEKFLLTVRMAKIMFGFIFMMSNYAFFMGILNALGEYSLPAMAPLFFNIVMIISTLVPSVWFPMEGDALAWGVLLGGLWQVGVLIPSLKRRGYFPNFQFSDLTMAWKNPDVIRVLKSMLPGLLGTGLLQITTIVNLRFASSLGEGAISYIYLADRLLELPLSLVSVSLGTALLPTLSKMWSERKVDKMLETSNHYLRLNLYVVLPAAVGLFFLAVPIIDVLFKRGKFDDQDLLYTAQVLKVYAFILITSSMVRVLVPVYYSIKNTWWPATISGVALVSHIILAPMLMANWGLRGLVFSSFISASINFLLLLLPIPFWIGPYGWWVLFKSLLKNAISAAAMGTIIFYLYPILFSFLELMPLGKIVALALTILAGACSFIALGIILKSEELLDASQSIIGKLKKRFAKKIK